MVAGGRTPYPTGTSTSAEVPTSQPVVSSGMDGMPAMPDGVDM